MDEKRLTEIRNDVAVILMSARASVSLLTWSVAEQSKELLDAVDAQAARIDASIRAAISGKTWRWLS